MDNEGKIIMAIMLLCLAGVFIGALNTAHPCGQEMEQVK